MTLPIPANLLTSAENQKRRGQSAAYHQAYARQAEQHREALAEYNRLYRKTRGDMHNGLLLAAKNRLAQVIASEKQAKSRWDSYTKSTLNPFLSEYNKYTGIEKANTGTDLDTLLGKATAFDPNAATQRVGAQRSLDAAMAQLGQQQSRADEDYTIARRQLAEEQPTALRDLLSSFAARGMAYSSGYGTALGNKQSDFARQQANVDTEHTRSLADVSAQQAAAKAGYYNTVGDILFNSANSLARNAGNLGLSGTDIPYLIELARRRLAATSPAAGTGG